MTRRRRGGIKSWESNLASNKFLICSPQSGTVREVHRVPQRREEGGRRWGDQKVRSRDQKERDQLGYDQFPKFSPEPRTLKKIHRVGKRREEGGRR